MEAAEAGLSLHLSKYHIVRNHMSRLILLFVYLALHLRPIVFLREQRRLWLLYSLRCSFQVLTSRDMCFSTMWHFDKCRLRRACEASFKLRNSKGCTVSSLTVRIAKALNRRHVWTGGSEPLLVAHTTVLEISCRGWFVCNEGHALIQFTFFHLSFYRLVCLSVFKTNAIPDFFP